MEEDKVTGEGAAVSQQSNAGERAENSNIHSKSHEDNKKSIFVPDDSWAKDLIPSLSTLCLENIVQNFESNPILYKVKPHERDFLLERLSTSLPLHVTAALISDGVYWRRCCEHRWETCDITNYGNSWKRMFFERLLEDMIEDFVPGVSDPFLILDMVPHCKDYIKQLNISQLRVSRDKSFVDHFDFSLLLHKLRNLEELCVIYNVKVCGMTFEWNMVEISEQDAESLAKEVQYCRTLKRLKLQRSSVKDEICQLMCPYLYHHPFLKELDLRHNLIGDDGAMVLSELLTKSRLDHLNLCDNHIQDQGAKALALALSKNCILLNLNLRLNRLTDEGGLAMSEALLKNKTLHHLNLAANDVTDPTAVAMSNVLAENLAIHTIDLSCNVLTAALTSELSDSRLLLL